MIQVRLLRFKDIEPVMVDNLDDFIEGINNVLGEKITINDEIDKNFEGYYLLPMGNTKLESGDGLVKESINAKVFLLSVINSSIPRILQECKPAGLTNWRFFKDAKTTIDARLDVLRNQRINSEYYTELRDNFAWYRPFPSDGTYETVAKSILKYLELYDNYLKNK